MSCGSATTLDFPAFPSAFPSAEFTLEFPAFSSAFHCPFPSSFPSAEGVGAIPCEYPSVSASPFAGGDPSETQLSVAAQVSANGGDPFPSEFISRFPAVGDGGAASGTTTANVALEDWCNEVAASMVQTAAPRVLGRKQRQRLMRQCICAFLPFPPSLVPLAFPTGQSAADVAVTEELNGHIDIFRIKKETQVMGLSFLPSCFFPPHPSPLLPSSPPLLQHVHVAMELCEGGDLFDRVASHGRLSEPSAARIFRSLMLALQHCHSHTIVHRDVKPEIILLSNRAINKDNVNGSAEAREVQVGEVQAGEVQVGEVQAGEVQVGEVQAGEVQAREAQVGEVQVGEAKVGEVKVGEAKVGEAKVGEAKVGEAKVGETKMGEVRAGELMMRPVEDFRSRACLRVFQTPRGHVQEVYPGPKTLKC
ncbi:unnamed protein product [Closterium sp. NIES-65]|nr:unnamed protein product [Closterium sp. NIES-65]